MLLRRRKGDTPPIPAHPYRDSAFVYAGMGVVIVVVATLTAGSFLRALGTAVVFFVIATAWTWWGYRKRIRARDAESGRCRRAVDGRERPRWQHERLRQRQRARRAAVRREVGADSDVTWTWPRRSRLSAVT